VIKTHSCRKINGKFAIFSIFIKIFGKATQNGLETGKVWITEFDFASKELVILKRLTEDGDLVGVVIN